jgi:hypothetical protein
MGKRLRKAFAMEAECIFARSEKNLVAALPKVLPKRPFALRFFAAFCRNALALTAANVSA